MPGQKKMLRPDLPALLSEYAGRQCIVWEDTSLHGEVLSRFGIVPEDMMEDRAAWGGWGKVKFTLEDINRLAGVSAAACVPAFVICVIAVHACRLGCPDLRIFQIIDNRAM